MRNYLIIFILIFAGTSVAQRKGASATGGNFSFLSQSAKDSSSSHLNLEWLFAYYFHPDVIFEITPGIQLDLDKNRVQFDGTFFGEFAYRILDMGPSVEQVRRGRGEYFRTTAKVYATAGAGAWFQSLSKSDGYSQNRNAPAFTLGLATHSLLGRLTLLRVKLQYLYLKSDGVLYDTARQVYKVSVGFSVFIRL